MVPEVETPGLLGRLVAEGTVTAPSEPGLPDVIEDLVPDVDNATYLLVEERNRGR